MRIDQRFLPYGVSIGLTAIALLLTLSLEPFLTQSVSAFFFVAITVSTWYGGLRPGFVAIVLSTLTIKNFFVPPLGQFTDITTSDLIRLAPFCLVAIMIHLLSHNLRNSKRRVEQLSQQLLEESADRLRTALNAAQMGMWDWNLVTGEINWSPEHEQLFGLTLGTFDGIYKTFESCLHPDDRETVNQAVQQALQTHSSYQNEFRVVWADGSIHWIEGRGHAFYDETGQPVRMTGTAMAIDARKQAEAALRHSEQRYRSLVHASAQIVWTTDADGRATAAPIGWDWEEMTGQPEAEHLGRGWLDVVHPDDRDRSLQHWLESCTHSTLYETEYRLRMKDGSYRDFAVRGVPILDADGNISEWIGTCTDITERKQAELALHKSEQQLKLALEAAHAGAWTWELTTNKQYWSEELYRVFGLEPGSVDPSYENADKRLHPEDREWVGTEVAKAIEQGNNTNLEHRILLPDGTVRWVNGISQMFLDESGQPETLAGLVVDITERKLAEIALRESEAKFRLLAETIEEVFLIQSADYSQTFYISPAYERIWERSCESLYQNPAAWIESVYPEDRDNLFAQMQLVMSGEICRTEYRMIKPSGELRWIGVQAFPVFDEAGQIYRLIASAQDITDRKQVQAALQESQIQLQRQLAEIETIYQSAPIGLNVVDTELRFVRINQRLAQMNGFPVEAHIGRTVRELLPDLADAAEQLLGSILETGEPLLNVEISGETPAQPGVQRTWLESFLPLKDGDQIIGISTVCEEITERKRIEAQRQQAEEELKRAKEELEIRVAERTAKLTEVNDRLLVTLLHQQQIEASLRQSEEKFRQLAENIQDVFWMSDLQSQQVLYVSPAYETIWQRSCESLYQNPSTWVEAIHPDHRQHVKIALVEQVKTGQYDIEYRIIRPDGSIRWIRDRAFPIRNETGALVRIAGMAEDITERKQAEAVLREAERRWRSLLDNVQLIVVGLDHRGSVNYVNSFFLSLTRYSEQDVLGKNWVENFLPLSCQQEVQTVLAEVLAHNFHPYYQNEILTKSGEERLIAWNNTLLQDLDGNIIGTISIGEDITERHKIEQIKNEFIGIVSHELRTPLTAIQLSLGLLKTGIYDKKPDKFKRMLEIALIDTNRLVNLVNDILDLERLESGQAVLEKTRCQAADLMQQAVDGVQPLAIPQQLTLTINPTDAEVWAAADAIIQTLTNLLSNAIKFSPADSTITLSAECQTDFVLFQVSDQGRGIPPDKLEAIFGRFQQVDASDARQKGGTGLGLAICRSIIERHGGQIWAQSTLGTGSTFFFILPLPPEEVL